MIARKLSSPLPSVFFVPRLYVLNFHNNFAPPSSKFPFRKISLSPRRFSFPTLNLENTIFVNNGILQSGEEEEEEEEEIEIVGSIRRDT